MAFETQAMRDARIDIGALLGAVFRRLPRIILVTLLLLAITYVLLMFSPKLYESSASILVEPRGTADQQIQSTTASETGLISSQIELIKSRDTLLNVIDQLDLRAVPEFNGSEGGGLSVSAIMQQLMGEKPVAATDDETILNNLYDRLTVVQERDSRLISVLVRSSSPQRAADIANAVANAHVARRAQLSLSDTAEASDWLRLEIERLRGVVTEAETAVADYKVNNDLFVGANNTSLPDQQLSAIATQITAAQERKSAAETRAGLIRSMLDRGQSIEGMADVRDSAVIQQLSQEKARLQGERAQRSATLLENHPVIQALNAQIGELDAQMTAEARRVAASLEAESQIEADLETSLQAQLADAKQVASTATQNTVTLDGLEREAAAQRSLLESYLARYNEAFSRTESDSVLPDVRVVSVAAPSVIPASPKTTLIMMAVGLVSVLLQLGLVVFSELISGRAITAVRPYERPQDELDEAPFVPDDLEPQQRLEQPVAAAPVSEVTEFTQAMSDSAPAAVAARASLIAPAAPRAVPLFAAPGNPAPAAVLPVAEPAVDEEPRLVTFADLATDLVLKRHKLLVLAAHAGSSDCEALAEELIGEVLSRGLSAALVDAVSTRVSSEAGLSDLSVNAATYGDVVHKSTDGNFADIPWGRLPAMSAISSKPLTLIEALGDIYDVIIVMTGAVASGSSLPLFQGFSGRLVVVAGDGDDFNQVCETRRQLLEAGFEGADIAALPAREAA